MSAAPKRLLKRLPALLMLYRLGHPPHKGPATMDDYIPLPHINALAYCPRRFYYEYVEAEMLVNEHVVEGRLLHGPSDEGGTIRRDDIRQERRIYVWSDRLYLAGII